MGGGNSKKVGYYYDENDTIRVSKEEFLRNSDDNNNVFKFDLLQGLDNCISKLQAHKINQHGLINLVSLYDLKRLARFPKRQDSSLKPLESIQFKDAFVIYLHHNWVITFGTINDSLGQRYKTVVEAADKLCHTYANGMSNCYLYMDFLSLPEGSDVSQFVDLAISFCDLLLTVLPAGKVNDAELLTHKNAAENIAAVREMRVIVAKDEKMAIEMYMAAFMPHRFDDPDRLGRFSGELYINLCCGHRPHFVYQKVYRAEDSDHAVVTLALVPTVTRRAFDHFLHKSSASNMMKILQVYAIRPLYEFRSGCEILFSDDFTGAGLMTFRNGATFKGLFYEGHQKGFGRYCFPTGGFVEGYFNQNQLNGVGKWQQSNGVLYIGEFANSLKQGNGKLLMENGDVYDGEFIEGKRSGHGVLHCTNGDHYEGMWLDDVFNGPGRMRWGSGQSFEGSFSAGKQHGVGVAVYPNGDIYKGTFSCGKKHGMGRMTFGTTGWSQEYTGQWKNDTMDGNGRITFINGDCYEGDIARNQFHGQGSFKSSYGDTYTGQFENGLQNGNGKMVFWNNCKYEGEWKDSKMHGKGKFTGAESWVYTGDWVEDRMEGQGTFLWSNGDVYIGQFVANQMHGEGTLTHASGNIYKGNFKHDRKEGKGVALKSGNEGIFKGLWKAGERTSSSKLPKLPVTTKRSPPTSQALKVSKINQQESS